jgi:cobalt-zinc-cadmium efflux system outer membrane protein
MKRALSLLLLAGCAIHPEGEDEERAKAAAAFEDVEAPELAPDATLDQILRRAYLANGGLRRMYWEWRAAIEEIPIAGSVKTNVGFTFEQMFDGASTSREFTTLGIQTDPMANLPWPGKLAVAARRALELARAKGFRFDEARRELASKVRQAWLDVALAAERVRLREGDAALTEALLGAIEARVTAARAPQQDLLKARNARDLAENALRTARARLPGRKAALNALLARAPDAAIDLPAALPAPRPMPEDDARLLALAAERHPELLALAREAAGREDGVRLSRLEWLPDLAVGFTMDLNGAARNLMAMLSAPLLRYEAIRAGVEQAKAELEAARAARRQAESDLRARLLIALFDARDVERAVALYEGTILPRSEQIVETSRAAYASGQVPAIELLDAQRARIEARLMAAELRIEREKLVAELEAMAGFENP